MGASRIHEGAGGVLEGLAGLAGASEVHRGLGRIGELLQSCQTTSTPTPPSLQPSMILANYPQSPKPLLVLVLPVFILTGSTILVSRVGRSSE